MEESGRLEVHNSKPNGRAAIGTERVYGYGTL